MLILVYLVTFLISSSYGSPPFDDLVESEGFLLPRVAPEAFADGDEYFLPNSANPRAYDIKLTLGDDWTVTNTFHGEVTITIDINTNVGEILLHARGLDISTITLRDVTGTANSERLLNGSSINNVTNILTVSARDLLTSGRYELTIHYDAKLSLTDMDGFYKSEYENAQNVTEYLATTQFESTSARRAFPCFDEPRFKAKFKLTIVHPSEYNALANTAGVPVTVDSTTTTSFPETPIMSTYLNAFIVSKFTCTAGADFTDSVPYSVCSRAGTDSSRAYAVDVGPKIIRALEQWTGLNYSYSGIGKMDQVGIPDFSAGAMENWGLVTYRETGILWQENESSNRYKQSIANVIAHEFAHMWFGNLVTIRWWNDLFLNEGFARYFQFLGTAEVETTWELERQFVIEQIHSILVTDSSTANPLSFDVTTPSEISGRFDSISYNKGASIIRMAIYTIGLDNFREGINAYLRAHQFDNAAASDLWTTFNNYNTPSGNLPAIFSTFISNWTLLSGYPILYVRLEGNQVVISQKRFLLNNGASTSTWYVPISYTLSNDQNKFTSTSPQIWLNPTTDEQRFNITSGAEWIILNNQQVGYYRVHYEPSLWDKIAEVLSNNHQDVHVINRAQIVDDLFNYGRQRNITFPEVFRLISFLKNDTDYYPWYAAFNGFSYILLRTGTDQVRNYIYNHVRDLMGNLYASVPYASPNSSDQIYTFKQTQALSWACRVGIQDCITNTRQTFLNYKNNNVRVDPNFRASVYCNGLRHSDNAVEDWEFLWSRYQAEDLSTEKITILNALGCTTDEATLKRFLSYAVSEDYGIRRQDTGTAFSSVYGNNPGGLIAAFRFIVENYTQIVEYNNGDATVRSWINTLASRFSEEGHLRELEEFSNTNNPVVSQIVKDAARNALATARSNMERVKELEREFTAFFSSAYDHKSLLPLFLTLFLVLYQFIYKN